MSAAVSTINPATGERIAEYARHSSAEVDMMLDRATSGFREWRLTSHAERAGLLLRLAESLEADFERAAATITSEMGKPISQAKGEIEKCVDLCRFYAERVDSLTAPNVIATEAELSEVQFEPLGPILGIMPWNFPYWQVFRWGVPTLVAGNTLVLSHADCVLGAARHIAELFDRAGAPDGLFNNLVVTNEACEQVIADDRIRGVSLTGSVRAGRAVASAAGRVIKPSVLELGGSDPCLVLSDVDLDAHLPAIVHARFQNTGQTCIAAKRYLVHSDIADEFTERLVASVNELTVGDPASESTDLGPMARADLRTTLVDQVDRCRQSGLSFAIEGGRVEGPGFYVEAAVMTDVEPGTIPFREELFGPVASVCRCRSIDQMVEWANATDYGLSANVWTSDLEVGRSLTHRLEAGAVFVNQPVKSDMRLPFGGIKNSGYGRELGGFGVREFANAKTVWIGKP